MTAFYSERDPFAAQWLRNLIAAGHIAPGVVSEEDVRDLRPVDLMPYTQVHLFAGIGIWSLSLRAAGVPDDEPLWTASCPCQPFSAAGAGAGFADERHLWPHAFHLISQCRPAKLFGEQVASKDGLGWLDLVSADMEGADYAFGAADLCAAGFGVEWQASATAQWLRRAIHDCADPVIAAKLRDFADWAGAGNIGIGGHHIRQRLYFVGVADALHTGRPEWGSGTGRRPASGSCAIVGMVDASHIQRHGTGNAGQGRWDEYPNGGGSRGLVNSFDQGLEGHAGDGGDSDQSGWNGTRATGSVAETGIFGGFGHNNGVRCQGRQSLPGGPATGNLDAGAGPTGQRTNAPHSERDAVDWLFCRDGKWRATRSGAFPLVNGAASRVGRLRAYGNGLDKATAQGFIEAVMAALSDIQISKIEEWPA